VKSTYRIELDLAAAAWRVEDKIRQLAAASDCPFPGPARMTLGVAGPFRPDDGMTEGELLEAVGRTLARLPALSFLIDGWERRRHAGGEALLFSVRLSEETQAWAAELASVLPAGAVGGPGIVAAPALSARGMRKVWRLLGQNAGWIERMRAALETRSDPKRGWFVRPVTLPVLSPRLLLVRDDLRRREYDLPSGRWLTPDEAARKEVWEETLAGMRRATGAELTAPVYSTEREVFVIGDLHLGHHEIIQYCARPFSAGDGERMDEVLIANWNHTVRPGDRVFYLGDLSYNESGAPLRNYLDRLNGRITFIRGNHDTGMPAAVERELLRYRGEEILFVHNPKKAPDGFRGWVVHGHTHNSDLRRSPFADVGRRRINVSAEVIGYRPVSLAAIFARIREIRESGDGSASRLLFAGEF
jgi:calcineurin-like phosphoesterase family protein